MAVSFVIVVRSCVREVLGGHLMKRKFDIHRRARRAVLGRRLGECYVFMISLSAKYCKPFGVIKMASAYCLDFSRRPSSIALLT